MVDLPLRLSQSKARALNSPSSPYIQYHYVSLREVLPLGWRFHTLKTWVLLHFVSSVLCFRWYFRSVLGHLFLLCIFLPRYCCLVVVLCGCVCVACLPPPHPNFFICGEQNRNMDDGFACFSSMQPAGRSTAEFLTPLVAVSSSYDW